MELSLSNLAELPRAIDQPSYDLARVRTGIVHLGFGGFHRAHMARYTHDLMGIRPDAIEWGIAGVGLLSADRLVYDALRKQDRLYTLVETQNADQSATVIGSISELAFAGDTSAMVLKMIDRITTRIVSLTITEHGYCLNPATKTLNRNHPLIRQDLGEPHAPRSAIGILVEAYRRRRDAGSGAFTALTCDNIQHNGRVLRSAVLTLAGWRDPGLADWIAAHARFPNTMVDRITPVTTPAQREAFASRFGVADRWPIFCEPFRQWVIEDDFAAGRPAWEDVGAQFVADVAPYEFMKLRLLNASHLAIAGLGKLVGHSYIDETMRDPALADYMRALMDKETGPTLPPIPDVDLDAYKRQLVERFANTAIKDTVDRVNTDAPVTLLVDPISDRLREGNGVDLLSLALAAWMRRASGIDEAGQPIAFAHPLAERLGELARAGREDPRPLLAEKQLFGDLGAHENFVATLGHWLQQLHTVGAAETLNQARQARLF